MRLSIVFAFAGVFLAAAVVCLFGARVAVTIIEDSSRTAVLNSFDRDGLTWGEVDANGLQVYLAGTAPSEADRFRALSVAGGIVDAARLIDQMLVEEKGDIAPPRFSMEILRNDSGISLIGLVPLSMDRESFLGDVRAVDEDETVSDFLESADYPAPDTWDDAIAYALRPLGELERTKISVDAGRVSVTAVTSSLADKAAIEAKLQRRVPDDVSLVLDISAPRPVITPFTLRFLIDDDGARFDACSADTEAARNQILAAARHAGLSEAASCTIGLGVPSPAWADAVEQSVTALSELGGGVVTFSDADISILAAQGTDQTLFDNVVGGLESNLPDVFALTAVLPKPPEETEGDTPEFTATLSPEGLVQLRGRISSAADKKMIDTFAMARFTTDGVHMTARVDDTIPEEWTYRVMTGLDALSYLSNGVVRITPDDLSVSGSTGTAETSAMIAAHLSEKLGEGAKFSIDVRYQEILDPVASLPTPEECEQRIAQVQVTRKITFEPGSANIDIAGAEIMDEIADILKECGELTMEISGHTDSQGREVMNQQLSQSRAQTVLNELRMRRVLTASISAIGYGESQPIADNETEQGRDANRRIEFKVIRPENLAEEETTLETLAEDPEEQVSETDETQPETETTDEQN